MAHAHTSHTTDTFDQWIEGYKNVMAIRSRLESSVQTPI